MKRSLEFFGILVVIVVGIGIAQFLLLQVNLNRALWWDEAIYVLMAKSIASGGQIGFFESFRPVVWPLLLAPFQGLFNQRFLLMSLSVFFNAVNLLLVYLIFKKLVDKRVALVSIPFIFFFSSVFKLSVLGLSEHLAILFSLLALLLFFKGHKNVAIILSAMAFLTRFAFGLVFVGILFGELFVLLFWRRHKSTRKIFYSIISFLLIFLVVISPYLIFMKFYAGSFFYAFKKATEVVAISAQLDVHGLFYYLVELVRQIPLVFLLPFSLVYLFKRGKQKETFTLFSIITCMLVYLSFFVQHKELRYLNLVVFLVVPLSLAVLDKIVSIQRKKKRILVDVGVLVILVLCFALEFSHSIYLFEGFRQSNLIDFVEHIPKNESEIISSDPTLGVYLNSKIFPFSSDYFGYRQLNLSEAQYFFRNNCSLLCPQNLSDDCASARTKLLDFLSEKTLVLTKQDGLCNLSLYKIK